MSSPFESTMDMLPNVGQMFAMGSHKFANTMFRGGYLDTPTTPMTPGRFRSTVRRARSAAGRAATAGPRHLLTSPRGPSPIPYSSMPRVKPFLARRAGAFVGTEMLDNSRYALGRSLGFEFERAGKSFKPRILAHLNPFRYDSVARLGGDVGVAGLYTPFQGTAYLVNLLAGRNNRFGAFLRDRSGATTTGTTTGPRTIRGRSFGGTASYSTADERPLYTGGLLGRANTMFRTIDYERAVAKSFTFSPLDNSIKARAARRRAAKATKRLATLDENTLLLHKAGGSQAVRNVIEAARTTEHGVTIGAAHLSYLDDIGAAVPGGGPAPTVRAVGTMADELNIARTSTIYDDAIRSELALMRKI